MEPDWRDRKEINGYRILHGNDTDIDLENDILCEEINGAYIINNSLRIDIKLNKRLTNVDGYDIGNWTMIFKQGCRIGEVLDRVPFGIIDKTITGLGATTLELTTTVRSSIIVVPTKALAYNKCIMVNTAKGDSFSMYVGSPIGEMTKDVTIDDVSAYLNKRADNIRKFIVVADSLPKLIDFLLELEEDVYSDYFLMIDEIDTMQADSAYRPRLEAVMDCYFNFKFYNRSSVSATISEFSNPKLKTEAYLRIEWEQQPIRNIQTLYTTYVDDLAWNEITALLEQNTDEKILVAYNSLDGIFNIMKHLSISDKDCGILCSERSMEKAKEYIDDADKSIDANGYLQKRVTFMTCAYFAGIDIMDKCHLIIISTQLQPFTYLSVNRISQIAGRCRLGNLSETIIYDIPDKESNPNHTNVSEYRESLIKSAGNYSSVLNSVVETVRSEPSLFPLKEFIFSYMDFIGKKKPSDSLYPLSIVRKDNMDRFVPAYFNIDALCETWNLKHSLYTDEKQLVIELINQGHIVEELPQALLSKEEHDAEEIAHIKEQNKVRLFNNFEILKDQLLEWYASGCNENKLKEIRRNTDKRLQETVIDTFVLLYQYMDEHEILDGLRDKLHGTALNNFINAAIFHILPYNHPFKASLMASYKVDALTGNSKVYYSKEERVSILKSIYKAVTNNVLEGQGRKFSPMLHCFFSWKHGKGYRVCGLNPLGFSMPKKLMPIDINIIAYLRIPK